MEDFMSDKQVAQREAGHPWLRARTVIVRDREYVSLDDAIEYAETRAIPIEQIAAAMADPLVGPLVNAMLTVHVNDGSAHDRAMAWSEGHTAGYDEGVELDVERLARAMQNVEDELTATNIAYEYAALAKASES